MCVLHLVIPRSSECFPRSTWMNCKIHAYSLTGFPPPANGLLHITQAAMHHRDTLRRSSPHLSTISYSKHARQRPKLRRRRLPVLHLRRGERAGAGRGARASSASASIMAQRQRYRRHSPWEHNRHIVEEVCNGHDAAISPTCRGTT